MASHNVAEGDSNLPDLIDRALAGESVVITRDGQPVVELRPIAVPPRKTVVAVDLEWLRMRRNGRGTMPMEDAGTLVSRMRDEGEK